MDDMFRGDSFGRLCDQFGIRWKIDITSQPG